MSLDPALPSTAAGRLAQLDEQMVRLTAQCQHLCTLLELRIARGRFRERETSRCLAVLSQVTARLAVIAVQCAALTGPDELARFWGAVSDRVFELAAAGGPDPTDPIASGTKQSPTTT